ncbi:ArsJ-associated glyceraldehyde-3-phosphate dehydrogenase [Skermanella rosea]|uniref:ArsJ-associated glyceraldehyde-3-phosphate dehydrogenase n=1 Tax=Skermanella rosea TaxID=1817965 RepID=UPI0019341CBB|nr:ArsJ-associated glyceraldehyde-3-phosphate dehydrogenase [Skermanella rosea]UEM01745.1 ArsJ-associated glyceraldehyde-3-phosphate dehydrogenase [Skermanella rosea]
MTIRVGINGFGRIGRLACRAAVDRGLLDIVHVNEVKGGPETAAHLLEFDSVQGRWPVPVAAEDGGIRIDGRRIGFTDHGEPGGIPWADLGVDLVLECSGKFVTTGTVTPHLDRGARKVVVAAPVKTPGALNVVMGVNDHLYEPDAHHVVTAASCTTNCLAPVVKVIQEKLGIRHGIITTIHDATNTQVVVDAPHKDLRRARSALMSLIPTSTGSATAIGLIYPELQGKLNGLAVRVPLLTGSLTDCVFEVARATTAEEVNAFLKEAADGPLKGILGFESRPLVSIDFCGDTRSSIIDGPSTLVVDGTAVKIFAWYDNEMGYAHRLAELAAKVAGHLKQN